MTSGTFEQIVETSAEEVVAKMLGQEVWKAVTFYFDMGKLASEPESFSSVLTRLFGGTAKVLQSVIAERIISKVGSTVETRKGLEFKEWIQIAKAKFQSSSNRAVQKH